VRIQESGGFLKDFSSGWEEVSGEIVAHRVGDVNSNGSDVHRSWGVFLEGGFFPGELEKHPGAAQGDPPLV